MPSRCPISRKGAESNTGSGCRRPHATLDGRTPPEVYRSETPVDILAKPSRALPASPQAQQQQHEDRFAVILATREIPGNHLVSAATLSEKARPSEKASYPTILQRLISLIPQALR